MIDASKLPKVPREQTIAEKVREAELPPLARAPQGSGHEAALKQGGAR